MNETIINGIDVSKYFIEVVDEGGSTIDYKILPNSERLLVEKIFEQNQQLARLQEENKKLKADLEGETEQCQKWYQLETDKHFQMLKYEQALEEIRHFIQEFVPEKEADYNSAKKTHPVFFGLLEQIKYQCNEVLDDRN